MKEYVLMININCLETSLFVFSVIIYLLRKNVDLNPVNSVHTCLLYIWVHVYGLMII